VESILSVSSGNASMRLHGGQDGFVWRAETFFTKEPDTIEWIAQMPRGSTLLDVGANIGVYSIWAAVSRGCNVVAVEPESQNYAALNANIHLNKLDAKVSAYCLALADHPSTGFLNLSQFKAGGSCHTFGDALDFGLKPFAPAFRQGTVGSTVDLLLESLSLSNIDFMKIDVDGIEHLVVAGAKNLINSSRLSSVLIEINTNLDEHWEIIDLMVANGFKYDPAQVDRARRKKGAFEGVGNYVFVR
jgi:FkbM family methyltransferase